MKICEKCGKEHDGKFGSGRFCSRACANSRVHSEETKERISKSLKDKDSSTLKNIKCSFCGKAELVPARKAYLISCSLCRPYMKNIGLFKKLGIYKESCCLEKISIRALEILTDLYFNKKHTTEMIYNEFNIRTNTTFDFFKKYNINLRSISEAGKLAYVEDRQSPGCNPRFKHG
jgi:hypothetical protein